MFENHPYGGVFRVELNLDEPFFSDRVRSGVFQWEDDADDQRRSIPDQGAMLASELEYIENERRLENLNTLQIHPEQAAAAVGLAPLERGAILMKKRHIKTHAYPRVGLIGNPSDGYRGSTWSAFTFKTRAEIPWAKTALGSVLSIESPHLNPSTSFAVTYASYYGGICLLKPPSNDSTTIAKSIRLQPILKKNLR